MLGDPIRLAQALGNYLHHAAKFASLEQPYGYAPIVT